MHNELSEIFSLIGQCHFRGRVREIQIYRYLVRQSYSYVRHGTGVPRSRRNNRVSQGSRLYRGNGGRLCNDVTTSTTAEPPPTTGPGALFISYSHKDRDWLDKLTEKLRPLQQRGEVGIWADSEIQPSQKFLDEISMPSAKLGWRFCSLAHTV
jgi:hypothetical protein